MDEFIFQNKGWEAGFEADRRIVVAKLGSYLNVFLRPRHFIKRFYQEVYSLSIQDWNIPIETLNIGKICSIETVLNIRFQATLNYAKEHIDYVHELEDHIKTSHLSLLKDLVELELQTMASDPHWIEQGHEMIEQRIENMLNEMLAIRSIQSRSKCQIKVSYASLEDIEADQPSPWAKHKAVYLEVLRRQKQLHALLQKQKSEQIIHEQWLKLEHEKELLQLAQKEDDIQNIQLQREIERFKSKLETEEKIKAEQRDSEIRLCEEKINHAALLKQLEMDAEFESIKQQEQNLADSEHKLKLNREAQLLEFAKKEAQARQIQVQWEVEQQKAEWAANEAREAERRQMEIRAHEEKIRHQAKLKQIEMEMEFEAELRKESARINNDHKLKIECETMALALKRQEQELLKAQRAEEIARINAERLEDERLKADLRENETKQCEEQLRHMAHLRELERSAEFDEKNRHSQNMVDMEAHLTREIELLALERQRLLLEEEVREIKASKNKGLIIDAKKRFPLGELEQPNS